MAYRSQEEKREEKLQPPQSLDAEQAVLGAILKDSDAMNQVVEVLDDESHFYAARHQAIFRAAKALYERGEPTDITMVANELLRNDELGRIGGRVYLVELVEGVASTANLSAHATVVLERSILRRLITTSNEIIKSCYAFEQPVAGLLDRAESTIFRLSESRLRKGFTSIRDLIPSTFEDIEALQSNESGLTGLPTGYEELDLMTNGMHKGDLVIVAGRPSMGKSALAMNIAEHVAIKQRKGVGVFSIEMSKEQLALRMLCGRAGISQQKLRAGKLRDTEWSRLATVGGILSEAPVFIDDSPTIRISVEHALKSLGHAMVCAENGRDALGKIDALIAQGHDIALCVLDVNMPEMDGISFLKEFRSRDKFTPVLILTTESEDDKIKEGRSHGASGWIIKPFKPDELLSVAKRFLK